MGEHLLCKQGVVGSIPSSSTSDCGEAGTRGQKTEVRKAIAKPGGLALVFYQ